MAKKYTVRSGFQSPSLGIWISPDTADKVSKLPEAERNHAIKQGYVTEHDVPDAIVAEQVREAAQEAVEKQDSARNKRGGSR